MDLRIELMARKDDYLVSLEASFRDERTPDVVRQINELLNQLESAGFTPVKEG